MITISRGATYRHRNCLDMDMYVVRIEYLTDDEIWLKVAWVYRKDPKVSTDMDRVRLKRKDLKNWIKL